MAAAALSAGNRSRKRTLGVTLAIALPTVLTAAWWCDWLPAGLMPDRASARATDDRRVPVAVLGDSDSHGYRDTRWMPPPMRGGRFRDLTLQWTEVLAALRGSELDLGDFGTWGGRQRVVRFVEALGGARRLPRKIDHEHNFAFSGAHCAELMHGAFRQAPRLRDLMDRDAERWRRGVVVIRIGIIDLGGDVLLAAMAKDPHDPAIVAATAACSAHVAAAVAHLREHHRDTRIVLVGILDNVDFPGLFAQFRAAGERANIRTCLDRYDDALRALTAADPRITFFDDRQWFRDRFGARDANGAPAYREVRIGDALTVTHRAGDDPSCSVLADNHAGLAWNVLWAQSLTTVLAGLGLPITPIADAEVERFVAELLARHR
jgi:hypothetical protein